MLASTADEIIVIKLHHPVTLILAATTVQVIAVGAFNVSE
jgi:hypothetical protein